MLAAYRFCLSFERLDALQHFGEADDAVQRRAQLVAHVGQEIVFQAIHLVEPHVQLRQLIHFAVQVLVHAPQFRLRVGQVPQHAVERLGQILELVVRVDLRPHLHLAAAHVVAHVPQVLERLDDHVAHDQVQGDHGHEDGEDGHGDQDGARVADRLGRAGIGQNHLHGQQGRFLRVRFAQLGRRHRAHIQGGRVAEAAGLLEVDRFKVVILAFPFLRQPVDKHGAA